MPVIHSAGTVLQSAPWAAPCIHCAPAPAEGPGNLGASQRLGTSSGEKGETKLCSTDRRTGNISESLLEAKALEEAPVMCKLQALGFLSVHNKSVAK